MLFEVEDLRVASPAAVSRCGVVYLTPEDLGWRPYVQTWLTTFFTDEDVMNTACKDHLWAMFNNTVDFGLEYVRTHFREPIKTTDLQQVVSICNFLECFISESKGFEGPDDDKKSLLDAVFAFSYAWGLGGSLDSGDKETFDEMVVRRQFEKIPEGETVYDYYFDLKKEKEFKLWSTQVPEFIYDKELPYFDLIVATPDTTKYSFIMESLLAIEKPLFFTGASGAGKSTIISRSLA